MIENSILARNREGKKALVMGLTFPSTIMVELAAAAGFDAIHLDGEHGTFSPESVDLLCRLANAYGMSVTARVPNLRADAINLYLDRGVQGVTGPHVETREEAKALVDACLFPPAGQRSWGGGRMTFTETADWDRPNGKVEYAQRWNRNIIILAQIESKKAWDNLDEILSVEGLTGVAGGPNDMAASMGLHQQPDHPDRVAAHEDVFTRTRAAGKIAPGDTEVTMGAAEVVLSAARDFAAAHRNDPLRS